MKKFILIITLLCPLLCVAQKEDRVWVFGDSICIDFNNLTNPVVSQFEVPFLNMGENYASISNKNGILQLYIGGLNNFSSYLYSAIYGASHITGNNYFKITNGDSICSNGSITQGALFIPFGNDTNKYYMFYLNLGGIGATYLPLGFYYAIIDKSIDSFGTCVVRDILLDSAQFTEKLTTVKHGNGTDWWIFIRKYNSNEFHKFLLTANGITGPFIQSIGPVLQGMQGQMKFSPDGSKLGFVEAYFGKIAIFNFNRCTGMLSGYKNLGNDADAYGCSFSSNSKIFYASTFQKLFQFDLDSPNIALSRQIIWYDSLACPYLHVGQHLLGPNNKIYIVSGVPNVPSQQCGFRNMNLTVINDPNIYGSGCNIQPYSFYLGGMRCMIGLPNMVNYNLGPLIGSPCDTIPQCQITQSTNTAQICNGDVYDFNGAQLTTAGIYGDTLTNVGGCDSLITLQLTILSTTASINMVSICSGESYNFNGNILTAAGAYADTILNVGGCDSVISLLLSVISNTSSSSAASICNGESYNFNGSILTAAGDYADTLSNAQGCDSIINLQLSIINSTTSSSTLKICEGDSVIVGSNIYYNDGTYIDTLINNEGCDSIVTSVVQVDSVTASITASADTLTAISGGVITYQWYNCDSSTNITGATNQAYVASITGNYAVIITDAQGCTKLSECVFVLVSGYDEFLVSGLGFSIYPNPTDGEITIVLRQAQHDKAEIEIIDVLGRVIIHNETTLKYNSYNLTAYAKGIYFVKVEMQDGGFGVKKFVKE